MGWEGLHDCVWPTDGVTCPLPVPPVAAARLHVMSGLWSGCGGTRCMWPGLCDPREPDSGLRPRGCEAGVLRRSWLHVAVWGPRGEEAKAEVDPEVEMVWEVGTE